ncbi:MAG TPA: BON domain-containing protein [Gemmatimonadaceae bacterium]|jgi:osmotically-inducible protein OsmY|nr:BON domain-containing protein [Gemmatimonadaceae bacterium]
MSVQDTFRRLKHDHEIHEDIRQELKWDLDVTDERDIQITVDHGVVSLGGQADSFAQRWAIEQAASRVAGVLSISNNLTVKPPKADDFHEDDELIKVANRTLEWDARVPLGVRATVEDGVVTLLGAVSLFSEKEAAEDAVRNLVGITGVENAITVSGPVADLTAGLEAAVRRRIFPLADAVSVEVADGSVTLRGTVPTAYDRAAIERAAWSVPSITRVDDQLNVS